jgi:hypothetical protein
MYKLDKKDGVSAVAHEQTIGAERYVTALLGHATFVKQIKIDMYEHKMPDWLLSQERAKRTLASRCCILTETN